MDDGTSVELERANLSSEAQTENLPAVHGALKEQRPLLEQSPKKRYLHEASEIGKDMARGTFPKVVNPYAAGPNLVEARNHARSIYPVCDSPQGTLDQAFESRTDAYENFVNVVKEAFIEEIDRKANITGKDNDLRTLFVSAREDKARSSILDDNLATARACISLLSNRVANQELATEISAFIPDRVAFYRKTFDEFEPPKEGD